MPFKRIDQARLIAVFCLSGLSSCLVHAQDLSMLVNGQISQSTCALVMKDQNGAVLSGNTVDLQLGTYAPSAANDFAIGRGAVIIESSRTVHFFAKNADLTTDCTLTNNSFWDLSMSLKPNQITNLGEYVALKNSIGASDGGTDAAVFLRGGLVGEATQLLRLTDGVSNYVSGSTTLPNTPTSSGLQLQAQMVRTTNGSPSVGLFKASVPLSFGDNNGRLQASSSQFGNGNPSHNLSYSGNSKDNVIGYGLTHSQSGSASSDSANLSVQHPWGYASGSFTSGSGIQQTGLSLGGGVVGHSGGVILSPTLGETFAIVEVANGQGASVAGSQSQVNAQGFAVVPYLSPYYLNDVQISLESASLNVDLDNAVQKIAPVEGSIVRLKFNATSGRAVVATFSLSNGRKLPIGTSVVDDEGNELGLIGQGNRGLLRLQKDVGQLKLVWGDKPEETCLAKYTLEKKTAANDNISGSSLIRLQLTCVTNVSELAINKGKP